MLPLLIVITNFTRMEQKDITEDEILEAMERSGYLLESEISSMLFNQGFLTKNSEVIIDPFTGKSREIDLTADFYERYDRVWGEKCISKMTFVFEIKNNIAPVVLLTKFNHSPDIEDWLALKRIETIPKELEEIDYMGHWDKLIYNYNRPIFAQYCSFERKKTSNRREIMALHPNELYAGISKITQYCEENIDTENDDIIDDGYWRNFIYIPVVLIADNLYELHRLKDNSNVLEKVETSMLFYNYHYKDKASMAYIYFVTKSGLNEFIKKMRFVETEVEKEMVHARSKIKDLDI